MTATTTVADLDPRFVVDFDVYEPGLPGPVDTMHERIAALRRRGPVLFSPAHGGHWLVTDYALIQEVLRDSSVYSARSINLTKITDSGEKLIPSELDPPLHTAFRKALQPLFNPTRMKALEPTIRSLVNSLIDGFAHTGRCELIADYAHEVPAAVFLALMGWPIEDGPMFTEQTDIALVGLPGKPPEESDAARVKAAGQMYEYFGAMIAERRGRSDQDDVTSAVINTLITVDGETRPLADQELCQMFYLMLIAGLHTVEGSLALAVRMLAEHPEQRQRLLDDSSLIPAAVEESLRYETTVAPARMVVKDTVLGGAPLKAGDHILTLLAGADRDPKEFADPDQMRIDRTPNRHIAFGSGAHRCIGSHLARIELQIALGELLKRIPDYRLDPDDPPITHASQVRGVVRMPLLFTPEKRASSGA